MAKTQLNVSISLREAGKPKELQSRSFNSTTPPEIEIVKFQGKTKILLRSTYVDRMRFGPENSPLKDYERSATIEIDEEVAGMIMKALMQEGIHGDLLVKAYFGNDLSDLRAPNQGQ